MNFWDENVYTDININELVAEVDRETNDITTEVIASYVVRKLSQRMEFLSGSVSCH